MDALERFHRDVSTPCLGSSIHDRRPSVDSHALLIDGDFEGKAGRVVSYDISRPNRQVAARDDAAEIDQRNMANHRLSESDVVTVLGIGPSVSVPEKVVGADDVIVGWSLAELGRCGGDGERKLGQNGGLEDSLRSEEGNPVVAKPQSSAKKLEGESLFTSPFE